MSNTIVVSGHSDDIISIEGAFRDELMVYRTTDDEHSRDAKEFLLLFSNGLVLDAGYDHGGIWRFSRRHVPDNVSVVIDVNPDTDEDRYSDVVTIHPDVGSPRLAWFFAAPRHTAQLVKGSQQ